MVRSSFSALALLYLVVAGAVETHAAPADPQLANGLNSLTNTNRSGSCPSSENDFSCYYNSYSSESQIGKLLHDHRNTDSYVHSAQSCQADLKNSFSSPAELESYFANSPDFKIGAPALLITKCNPSEHLPGPLRDEEVKASIAEYYTDAARLNNSVKETLQAIAAIDSMQAKPLLSGVDCTMPVLKDSVGFCTDLRNSCKPQGGNFEVAAKAKQNLVQKKTLEEQIHWFKQNPEETVLDPDAGPIKVLSAAQNAEIKKRNDQISDLEKDTPLIRDDSTAAS